jgi:hypothetical protein
VFEPSVVFASDMGRNRLRLPRLKIVDGIFCVACRIDSNKIDHNVGSSKEINYLRRLPR